MYFRGREWNSNGSTIDFFKKAEEEEEEEEDAAGSLFPYYEFSVG